MTFHAVAPLSREAAILSAGGLSARDIAPVIEAAKRVGVTSLEHAVATGAVAEEAAFRALAVHLRLPFTLDAPPVADDAPWPAAARRGLAPLAPNRHGWRFVLAPRGDVLRRLMARDGRAPASGLVMTTPTRLAHTIVAAQPARIATQIAHGLPDASPRESCRDLPGVHAVAGLVACVMLVIAGLAWNARVSLQIVALLLGAVFFLNVAMRLSAILGRAPPRPVPPRAPDHMLPHYTVLVALYREKRIVDRLLRALRALDYPAAKLEILILLEADDGETRAAIEAAGLAPSMRILVAPDGAPRTKPRALNLGLAVATGDLVTVFDAEDRPEPQQLRKAAAAFAEAPRELACFQARLAIENATAHWLTRFFALEYATLFGLIIPGLAAQQLPIALGGTSNHFRTADLRAVGGWDAWNVTEDADLGLRLYRKGFRIGALDSTTWEEAPPKLKQWMNQRRRWLKGWMQTTLVHVAAPRRPLADLGLFSWLCSLSWSGGVVLSALFGPLFLVATLSEIGRGAHELVDGFAHGLIWGFSLVLLVSGVVAVIAPAFVAARQQGLSRLLGWIPLLPFYYLLVSVAGWLAFYDLLRRPHHWFKTEHGFSVAPDADAPEPR